MRLLCTIVDRLAESVGPVMVYPAVPAAIRAFGDVATDSSTMVFRHPEDFDLIQIASIDERTGELTANLPPKVLLTGVAWKAAQNVVPQTDGQLSLLKEA